MYTLDYSDAILLYYLFFAKIIPMIVTYFFDKRFNIKLKFKSISLLNACIQNIQVKLPWGYEISIGELGLKSKYLSSEYKRPFCVELEDVKISQTFESDLEARTKEAKNEISEIKNDDNFARYIRWAKVYSTKILNYLLQFLPPTAMIILQFLGIHIKNLTTTLMNREKGPMATLSVPNVELTFDGCFVKNNRTLFIALALQHINSKFFAYNKQNPSRKPHQACLAEIVFDLSLEVRTTWSNKRLLYEKFELSTNNTQVTFYGGLFDIIEHVMLHTKPTPSTILSIEPASLEMSNITNAPVDVEKLIETLTPDLMIIHLDHIEVKSLSKENSFHYHLLLQRVEIKGKFKSSSNTSRMKISNMRIYTPSEEVLHLKEVSIDVKRSGNLLTIGTKLDTLNVVYNHDDIYGWFVKIIHAGMKSNRKEFILRAIRIGKEKMIELYHSELTQRLFNRIILNILTELRNVSVILLLEDQISSINIMKVKLLLNQSEHFRRHFYEDYTLNLILKDRQWSVEAVIDEPLCWYMDQKFDYQKCDSKKSYIRGSALFIGSSSVILASNDETFTLNLRVDTLRTEYSNKLTKFTVKSIQSFKEFIDLFSKLNNVNEEANSDGKGSISIEKILNVVAIDAELLNVSCFFINRHDVCTFMNLSQIKSTDSFNYNLDTLQVSTVDFSQYDSVYDLTEFSSVYVSTETLKINLITSNDQPQIGVDFAEKLECKWDAHFIRHLLSLVRDFHRFRQNLENAMGIQSQQKSLLTRSLPVGLDIKKLRNIRIKHADVNVDKLILLINELSGENLFFYHYFQ